MDDIAKDLGISKKTLYLQVKDKGELVEESLKFNFKNFKCNFSVFEDDSLNAIEQYFLHRQKSLANSSKLNPSFSYDLRKYYPALYEEMNDKKQEIIYQIHYKNLEKGKKEGFYRSNINSDIIARVMVGYVVLTFNPNYGIFSDKEVFSRDVWESLMAYHFFGICTPKGIDFWEVLFEKEKKEKDGEG